MAHRQNKVLIYVFIVVAVIWTLMPVYWMVNLSFQFENAIYTKPPQFFPKDPTNFWYFEVLHIPHAEEITMTGPIAHSLVPQTMRNGLRNSILVALPVSFIAIGVSSVSGYVFGRLKFRFKNGWLVMLLASQTLPPVAVVLPYYILFQAVGLLGTLHGLTIIYLSLVIPIITWILMSFFATLPLEVERAARIDGCGRFRTLRKVILPMAAPGLVAGWVLAFLTAYNEFMYAWILTGGSWAETLPPALTGLFFQETVVPMMSAAVMLSLLPVFVLALVFQKYITELRIVDPVTVVVR